MKCLTKFTSDNRGTTMIIFAFAFLPVLVAAGGTVDLARTLSAKTDLQQAVDAAAMAGARLTNVPDAERMTAAGSVFDANYDSSQHGAATPAVTVNDGSVSVSASTGVQTMFLKAVGISEYTISASATVVPGENHGDYVCMLALNPTMSEALKIRGSRDVAGPNCTIRVNSNASDAVDGIGNAYSANVKSVCAVGGGNNTVGFNPSLTSCENMDDPYKRVKPPVVGGCDHNNTNLPSGFHSLDPGVYCGGIVFRAGAIVTLKSGVYVIKGGEFEARGGSAIYGSRVALHLTGSNAALTIQGGATVSLKAPKDDELAGFVVYQDADSNPGSTSVITGGGFVKLEGVLYQPTHKVHLEGSGDLMAQSKMWAMVAGSFELSGSGLLQLTPDNNGADLPDITPTVMDKLTLSN